MREHTLPKLSVVNLDGVPEILAERRRDEHRVVGPNIREPIPSPGCSSDDESILDVKPPDLDRSMLPTVPADGRQIDGSGGGKTLDRGWM